MTELNNQFYASQVHLECLKQSTLQMEPTVRQYEIVPSQSAVPWWKKCIVFLAVASFMFIFRWAVDDVLHDPHQPLFLALITPLVMATFLAFRPFGVSIFRGGSLIIGEGFIEGRTRARWFTFKKRISRDRIKSISENRQGLCIMDRGEFAARMLGFIFVPATMPEYQEIKATLTRWTPLKQQG